MGCRKRLSFILEMQRQVLLLALGISVQFQQLRVQTLTCAEAAAELRGKEPLSDCVFSLITFQEPHTVRFLMFSSRNSSRETAGMP